MTVDLPSGKVFSSPISLLHRDPPQVYTTARRNARPHSLSVFVFSCVWTCATQITHSRIESRSRDLMEPVDAAQPYTQTPSLMDC